MPWKCRKHKDSVIAGQQSDKIKPSCPKCDQNTFVYWDTGGVEFVDTLMRDGAVYKVYIETHQGKHVIGGWPGYKGVVGGKYATFKGDKVKPGQTTGLLPQLWDAVASTITAGTATSGYAFLECTQPVGSAGETFVILQWGKTAGHDSFHAYPEKAKRPGKTYVGARVT